MASGRGMQMNEMAVGTKEYVSKKKKKNSIINKTQVTLATGREWGRQRLASWRETLSSGLYFHTGI